MSSPNSIVSNLSSLSSAPSHVSSPLNELEAMEEILAADITLDDDGTISVSDVSIEKALPALIADTKEDIKQKSMELAKITPTDITYMDKKLELQQLIDHVKLLEDANTTQHSTHSNKIPPSRAMGNLPDMGNARRQCRFLVPRPHPRQAAFLDPGQIQAYVQI
ncbi:unnamed protein product [Absidia cylindrospora]